MAIYSDIDITLNKKRDGDIAELQDLASVGKAIENILTTRLFSRRMLQEFALNPNNLLFDPIDRITAQELGNMMLDSIQNWDARVRVTDLLVRPEADKNRYNIHLKFEVINIPGEGEINFIMNRN